MVARRSRLAIPAAVGSDQPLTFRACGAGCAVAIVITPQSTPAPHISPSGAGKQAAPIQMPPESGPGPGSEYKQ